MNDDGIEFSEDERRSLRELRKGPEPDAALERRTVEALEAAGILHRRGPAGARWLAAAAAVLVVFAAGFLAGRAQRHPTASQAHDESGYILLLYQPASLQPRTGAALKQQVEDYRQWAQHVRASGVDLAGTKLTEDIWRAGEGGPGDRSLLTGYFVVRVPTLGRALELARECPHLRYGGSVVIRKIDPV